MSTVAGIDVGEGGLGFSLWRLDSDGTPVELLSYMTVLHDGGVHRGLEQRATSRIAAAGVARRVRRMYRRRRARLKQLDNTLRDFGYPLVDLHEETDPWLPWGTRAELATEFIPDDTARRHALSIAVRHIARHRGWRNPYEKVEVLRGPHKPSDEYWSLAETLNVDLTGLRNEDLPTVGQLVADSLNEARPPRVGMPSQTGVLLRGPNGIIPSRLRQSDYASELQAIFETQGVEADEAWELIRAVFAAESPRGSWAGRIGKDPLPGQGHRNRALKADPAFQEFRIRSVVANLRIRESGGERPLTSAERVRGATLLMQWSDATAPTWSDVAEHLGVERDDLRGTARAGVDGEPTTRPPIDATSASLSRIKVKAVKRWWSEAHATERATFIDVISSNPIDAPDDDPAVAAVAELMMSLTPDEQTTLDSTSIPSGRAAYSRDSLARFNSHMLSTEDDVYQTRRAVFGVSEDWHPPAERIGAPVGHPSVDRTLKLIAQWLLRVESEWGAPSVVIIEHVRDGFVSPAKAREQQRANDRRRRLREKTKLRMQEEGLGDAGTILNSQLRRFLAVQRQNCECLYCGATITYSSAQMDHIVPRKSVGSRSTDDNLVAVCASCNVSKSNIPFGAWVKSGRAPDRVVMPEALNRVWQWRMPDNWGGRRELIDLQKRVYERLKRTEADDPVDERSMASTAWMARELAARVRDHFADAETSVRVFRGSVTAEARKAAGVDKQLHMIGGTGKQRIDRRHHAVDAAFIALLRPYPAQVLAERTALRHAQRDTAGAETWKQHRGTTAELEQSFNAWMRHMDAAVPQIQQALDDDRIPVVHKLRLGRNVGSLHEATVYPLEHRRVGEALPTSLIDRAATPQLWYALTRHPDFDPADGLPEDETRELTVQGKKVKAAKISFFGTSSAALATQGGYVTLGASIHHARIYRYWEKGKTKFGMVRVFAVDLPHDRNVDLFTHLLRPGCISIRSAAPGVRTAVNSGAAEYLGWLVPGDEVSVKVPSSAATTLAEFNKAYPNIRNWEVSGFESATLVNLRPILFAPGEELLVADKSVSKFLSRGWRASINSLLAIPDLRVVRRDALGRERSTSRAHLPISWSVPKE